MSQQCRRDLASRVLFLVLCLVSTSIRAAHVPDSSPQGSTAVVVRVEGLALGSEVQLRRAGELLTANLNDEYRFATPALPGSALGIELVAQPPGQTCAVSDLAPGTVPADSSPVFVRCLSIPGASVVVPETLPGGPLRVLRGESAVRGIAYPGLPYESRLGVVGGTFPYEFRIISVTMGGTPMPPSSEAIRSSKALTVGLPIRV